MKKWISLGLVGWMLYPTWGLTETVDEGVIKPAIAQTVPATVPDSQSTVPDSQSAMPDSSSTAPDSPTVPDASTVPAAPPVSTVSQNDQTPTEKLPPKPMDYEIGIDDVLTVDVLQPEKIESDVTVSPDGNISFPYVGSVIAAGRSLTEVEQDIEMRLANGYFKYPSVVVYLKQSRSRRFFVYGEVNHPGPYPIEDNTTVLKAIAMAEGFTRFGSASHVKVLRIKKSGTGYNTIAINIKDVMEGDSSADLLLQAGDVVVVSEGVF